MTDFAWPTSSPPVSRPPESTPPPTPPQPASSGKWRVLASFVAGATIGVGSFGLGMLATENDAPPISTVQNTSTVPTTSGGSAGADAGAAATLEPTSAVALALGPSVVQIETDLGLGSGVVFDDGLILTNDHVIDGATQVSVRTSDGRSLVAVVLGSDPRNDIAVLQVDAAAGLPVAPLALDSETLVGQTAIAIGSPFQLQQTVTSGIVSALNRPVPNSAGGFSAMIQTDAPINPGNSGGALADIDGEVIGINTSIRTDGTGNSSIGIGFAVPIQEAIDVAQRILNGESLEVGVLGVSNAQNTTDNAVGVVVGEVVAGSAADQAGLQVGDRVLKVNDAPVTNFAEVVGLVQSKFGGDVVTLLVQRGDQTVEITATLT